MTRTNHVLPTLGVLLTLGACLAGCKVQQPPTVIPPAPRIEAFSASATLLPAAGDVTLSWQTANTTSVSLAEASGGALSVPVDQLTGTFTVNVTRSSIFVLVARGEGGTEARAVAVNVERAPADLTLVAVPPVIAGGGSTTLAWTAPGASNVTLRAGTEVVDTRGQLTSGALVVTPSRDTTWTLTDGTRTVTATVDVQVALLSASANVAAVQPGDPVTLTWTTAGAERLIITSPGRGQLSEVTAADDVTAGTFTDTAPARPVGGVLTYELTAESGTERMSRTVTVFVSTGLAIARFDVPPVAAPGATIQVRWQTVAADEVEIAVDGLKVYTSPTAALAAQGGFAFTAPNADFEVELVALNARGDQVTRLAQVDSVGVPTSATLTASPTSVAAGSPVTLTFAAADVRRVRITNSDGQAVFSLTGQSAESGTATVYPSASTTYTLTAENLLGDPAVTATADVTVTGTPTVVTQFPPTAIHGQVVELRPSVAGALLYGFPHDQVLEGSLSNFIDISGTGTRVLEQGGDVTQVTLPFTTWLWGQRQTGPLTISRAGWMAWGAPLVVNSSETALPSTSTSAAPGLIAPYWDNLSLIATSAVLVQVLGEAPEQRLIVQWDRVQTATAGTELTFQVQVHQAGVVSFHYKTMELNSSPSYTVGLQDPSRQVGFDLLQSAPPAPDTSLYFFSPLTVPASTRVFQGTTWGGFVKNGSGYSLVTSPARAVKIPQDLALTELMFRPAPTVAAGQYIEAYNRTAQAFDLSGWLLRSGDGSTFALPNGTQIGANGVLVVGASSDRNENDDAGVNVSWAGSGFSLGVDGGSLNLGTADAGYGVIFNAPSSGTTGVSVEIDPGPFVFQGSSTQVFDSCYATTPFGFQVPQQLGSPGASLGCGFPYRRDTITPNFRDISTTGTVLLAEATNVLDRLFTVTLAPGAGDPRPSLFGTPAPVLTVSSNGWLSPRTITVAGPANKTSPTVAEPIGTIAPFWDDLEGIANVSTLHWQRIEPGVDALAPGRHWIFQWTHFSTDPGSSGPDDLTFQAKLFEDGTIEFHYATMTSGTTSFYGEGASATVWVENGAGTQALIVSANSRAPRDNTAVRFSVR